MNASVDMHAEHRTWFPYIVMGLSVALALVIAIWVQPSAPTSAVSESEPVQDERPVMSEEEYRSTVNAILLSYDASKDAHAAYAQMLDIVVPPAYKEVHLELVIILGKFDAAKPEEAQARYDLLKQQHGWLAL